MPEPDRQPPTRREFLAGDALRSELEHLADRALSDAASAELESEPAGGPTLRLQTRAMACDFAVLLNEHDRTWLGAASDALETVHALEDQMTVYREHSELSQLNRRAALSPVQVEPALFELLQTACRIARETGGSFDPTSGPLVALWRQCRAAGRIPTGEEIAAALQVTGVEHVEFDAATSSVRYRKAGVELNLGGIGKGYALDRIGETLAQSGVSDWLVHGGHSSLLARGDHGGRGGWPVGIRNPLFPTERLATIVLRDCALSSSGSGVQSFRYEGRRYGHILDPRTGVCADELLSVTVLAPTAAEADALSTAFFVMGVENALRYCDNWTHIGALLIPPPRRGRRLEPVVRGIPDELLFYSAEQT